VTQRFTVELERTVVKTATVEVVAENIKDARDKAIVRGRSSYIWNVDEGITRVLKITAHANGPDNQCTVCGGKGYVEAPVPASLLGIPAATRVTCWGCGGAGS
jgi:hypothetical protein